MLWKDFLYFSKGERRALLLLLLLIAIAGILLLCSDRGGSNQGSEVLAEIAEKSDTIGNVSSLSASQEALPAKTNKDEANLGKRLVRKIEQKETIPERVKRLAPSYAHKYKKIEKYPKGTVVDLNSADTVILKKVPGIGSAFSKRIVKYRALLKGFYAVCQLREVYGIDEERYENLKVWFQVDSLYVKKLNINRVAEDSLRHPYLSYPQRKELIRIRRQQGEIDSWDRLRLLEEFTADDIERLSHYFSVD